MEFMKTALWQVRAIQQTLSSTGHWLLGKNLPGRPPFPFLSVSSHLPKYSQLLRTPHFPRHLTLCHCPCNPRDCLRIRIYSLKPIWGASLVVQWLRIPLPMQGTRGWALVQEDPTCRWVTKPVRHNYWACALEPTSHNYWACVPQLLKPTCHNYWGPRT